MSTSVSLGNTPDDELVLRARAGDLSAFDSIVKRYLPVMLGFFLKELGADQFQLAEDLASETMTAAWTTLRNGQSVLPENLKAWLFGTARHVLSHHFREKSTRGEVLVFEPESYDVEDSKSPVEFREVEYQQGLPQFLKLVNDAIDSMPVKYRDVIRTNMRDGSIGKALGARLGVTPAEASRRLNEARPLLAKAVSALLVARTCRKACLKLDFYLQNAGWSGGPFSEELRQRLMQHISSCVTCTSARNREMDWMKILPVVVPGLVASELYHRVLQLPFTAPGGSPPSASPDSSHGFHGANSAGKTTTPSSTGVSEPSTSTPASSAQVDTPVRTASYVSDSSTGITPAADSPKDTLQGHEGNDGHRRRSWLLLLPLIILLFAAFPAFWAASAILGEKPLTSPPIPAIPVTQQVATQPLPSQPPSIAPVIPTQPPVVVPPSGSQHPGGQQPIGDTNPCAQHPCGLSGGGPGPITSTCPRHEGCGPSSDTKVCPRHEGCGPSSDTKVCPRHEGCNGDGSTGANSCTHHGGCRPQPVTDPGTDSCRHHGGCGPSNGGHGGRPSGGSGKNSGHLGGAM